MIRTRFAPSPTGYLHIGGARTALYCYLMARQSGGQFILRIEDTDLERSTPESVRAILEGMAWLKLDYDEGPFYQTERFDRYRAVAQQLVQAGKAYRCTCSKERLEQLREAQQASGQKPRYDGHCRKLNLGIQNNDSYVIRFCNSDTGNVSWQDLVKGEISFQNTELDDLIIIRSDGSPTYNFTVVVDDYDMKITHVIRGDDHVNNTPRQINILKALNTPLPHYAHVPMILGEDGKRLSKRHGAVGVMQFQDEGYLPEALLNYLFRLGFAHGDQEIFSRDEMIRFFDLTKVNHSPAMLNYAKLNWLNQHYLKTLSFDTIKPALVAQLQTANLSFDDETYLEAVFKLMVDRVHTLKELVAKSHYFFAPPEYEEAAKAQHLIAANRPQLAALLEVFTYIPDWQASRLHEFIVNVAKILDLGMGKVAMPLRVAVTGTTQSPSIDVTLALLGRERVVERLKTALDFAIS